MAEPSERASLVDELVAYGESWPLERTTAERIARFVQTDPACFERTHEAGHLTGSAWVVDRTGRYALLTHHRKLDRWLQLGGHADACADLRAVARREAAEESGLATIESACASIYDLDVHEIPARGAEPAHLHYDVRFAFFADPEEPLVVSSESHALAWIALDRIDVEIDESVRRLARKTGALVAAA